MRRDLQMQRRDAVLVGMPRIAYLTSDVLVVVSTESLRSTRFYARLYAWAQVASGGACLGARAPALLVVSNMVQCVYKDEEEEVSMDAEATTKGTQVACFAGTKVQILTPEVLDTRKPSSSGTSLARSASLPCTSLAALTASRSSSSASPPSSGTSRSSASRSCRSPTPRSARAALMCAQLQQVLSCLLPLPAQKWYKSANTDVQLRQVPPQPPHTSPPDSLRGSTRRCTGSQRQRKALVRAGMSAEGS